MWLSLLALILLYLCTKGALELAQASIRRGTVGLRVLAAAGSIVVLLGAASIFAFIVFLAWLGQL